MARYACVSLGAVWLGLGFPWGTIIVNILGSFVIGFFATVTGPGARLVVSDQARLFVMVGVCGGYTTFSSFSLQTLELIQGGQIVRAGANVIGSVALCLAAAWVGYLAAASLHAL